MAFEQINTADFDYEMMLATINAAYIGKAEITLSNYDNDSAPVIKVGAKIEVNGALIKLTTSDATPSGYAGITNSTTFFLYYDSSAGVAIYSNTVPVWNDALQGWYNGNDRAFFSMYKDSGGTLYESKVLLLNQNNLEVGGYLSYKSKRITSDNFIHAASITQNDVYDKISPFLPSIGNTILVSGGLKTSGALTITLTYATRLDANTIRFSGYSVSAGSIASADADDGSATQFDDMSISW